MIGITGGIASGKTTVAQRLRSLGYTVLDADLYAKEALDPGTSGWRQVVEAFPQVVEEGQRINRAKLAAIIFTDQIQRRKLEKIVHPLVVARLEQEAKLLQQKENLVFAEIPLLFEAGLEASMDEVWVVYVDQATQLERLLNRSGVTRELAEQMIASQLSLEEKRAAATRVIDNNGTLETTWAQLDRLLEEVRNENSPYRS